MGIREILTVVFLMAGLFFVTASTIGVLRMKDFYCRLHAAGVGATLGLVLCSIGLFIYEGFNMTGIKIFLIFLAVFLVSPIGTHIIGKVSYKQRQQYAEEHGDMLAPESEV